MSGKKPLDQSGFFKLQYLTKEVRYDFEFLCKINKFTQSFQVGMVWHVWMQPKSCQIVSQFYLKNELSYKVGFSHMVKDPWKI